MTVKKLRYLAFALTAVAFCACQKEPSTSSLHKDYLVYTAHDTDADFAAFDTYYIPDSILLIGSADKTEYWKDANALEIVNTVVERMNAAGYTRTDDKDTANLGLQLSYVQKVTYFVGYDYPYWWWYYPLLLDARLLGRLGRLALSLQRLLRIYGRFAARGDDESRSRSRERQEAARDLGQLYRRAADLVGGAEPAAHGGRRATGFRSVALSEKII